VAKKSALKQFPGELAESIAQAILSSEKEGAILFSVAFCEVCGSCVTVGIIGAEAFRSFMKIGFVCPNCKEPIRSVSILKKQGLSENVELMLTSIIEDAVACGVLSDVSYNESSFFVH
jgi:hypothetical protein